MNFLTASLPASHGFFTRAGGLSTGYFASLNCSLSGADDRELVLQNRAIAAAAMGIVPSCLLGMRQVHGVNVIKVTRPWEPGAGPDGDAMITALPGVALGIVTADCAPVLFSDGGGEIIGAAHAGWRGALAGVLEATAAAMQGMGARNLQAAIGPCIHQESYEVATDLRDAVLAGHPADTKFFHNGRPGRWQFDLPGYCAARLRAAGVAVEILPHDTCADEPNFFSHRRRTRRGEPAIGHQISVIRI